MCCAFLPQIGGSVVHKTAVALNYDLDLVLEVPSNVGNRRIWRKTHKRMQALLKKWGGSAMVGTGLIIIAQISNGLQHQ